MTCSSLQIHCELTLLECFEVKTSQLTLTFYQASSPTILLLFCVFSRVLVKRLILGGNLWRMSTAGYSSRVLEREGVEQDRTESLDIRKDFQRDSILLLARWMCGLKQRYRQDAGVGSRGIWLLLTLAAKGICLPNVFVWLRFLVCFNVGGRYHFADMLCCYLVFRLQ